jgi:hypothetical protein
MFTVLSETLQFGGQEDSTFMVVRQPVTIFRSHLNQLLNSAHPLVVLAKKIDRNRFQVALRGWYNPGTRAPAKAVRLIVVVLNLKHAFDISDESVFKRWVVMAEKPAYGFWR